MSEIKEQNTKLQFTGNWLIDAGILGFVNLMEDVYGWDLKSNDWRLPINHTELEGRFTYAFWYKTISTTERWLKKDNFVKKHSTEVDVEKIICTLKQNKEQTIQQTDFKDISSVKEKILDFNKECKDIIRNEFQGHESDLKKTFSNNKKTILENLNDIGFIASNKFLKNLSIFNNKTNKSGKEKEILESFLKLVREYSVLKSSGDILDKTINIFLPSAKEFHNAYFGSPPTLKKIEELYQINPTYMLLSIPWSFIKIQKYHFFHTNSLENSYYFHRYLQRHKDALQTNRRLLDVTWQALIDLLIEKKADFSLENIHLIEYSGIAQQKIQDVEYLSISKLNATLLLDDIIRENLNKKIPCNENRKDDGYVWLIEQLLNEKPLTPLIIEYVERSIKQQNNNKKKTIFFSLATSLYSLIIDANKQRLGAKKLLFDCDFFKGYTELVDDIKRDVRYAGYASDAFSKCTADENEQDLYKLFTAIKGRNRNQYLNTLYRMLVKSDKELDKKMVSDYAFNNIIKNKNTWTYYGLALILKAIIQWKKQTLTK
ncbi:MAG: hypothetical protein QXE82_01705 [Candidatus Nitrosotenuis sp.]